MKKAIGIATQVQFAERTLSVLRRLQLVDKGLEFARDDKEILIPLLPVASEHDIARIREHCPETRIKEHVFRELTRRSQNLPEYLQGKIPNRFLSSLTRSYDMIGDIALIELSEDIIQFSSIVGQGLLEVNPHLRLVLRKLGGVTGPYRTRRFEIIAGAGSTETYHKEFSCLYHLDITKVYFNPRLSHERLRVARQVKPYETVLDMFAGVGPYSILIARTQPTSTVKAADINTEAFRYLKENTFINGVADRVVPTLEDARELSLRMRGSASRVIMNLPSESEHFLGSAALAVRAEGGTIHYYTFAPRNEDTNAIKETLRRNIGRIGREISSFPFCDVVREIAPNRVQVAVDILLK